LLRKVLLFLECFEVGWWFGRKMEESVGWWFGRKMEESDGRGGNEEEGPSVPL
jgi:hypothetical protein